MYQVIKDIKIKLDEQEKKAICNVSYNEFREEFLKQLRQADTNTITQNDLSYVDSLITIAYKTMKVSNLLQDRNDEVWKQLLPLFMLNIFEAICNLESEEN